MMRECDAGEVRLNPMEVSVVVPAYNEESTLQETVSRIDELLRLQNVSSYEIIIVNDGSVDATLEKAEALTASLASCYLISYPRNRGKGYALRQGFLAARGRLVAFIDADGEIDPQQLLFLLSRQQTTSASVTIGQKIVLGSRPWYRKIMTWSFGLVGKMLFGLPTTDSQTGLKVLVREDVEPLVKLCQESGYLFDLELLILTYYQGMSITTVPVEVRILRPSRITVASGFASLGSATKLYLRWESYRQSHHALPDMSPVPTTPVPTAHVRRIHALTTPLVVSEESYDVRS
jgi:dolichol-phosphate mannosyltransferase